MKDMILELSHVTKNFGGLKAVNDISFSVRRGELLGIAGPNGSGKSTLFNLITRIPYGPTTGKIYFDGKRIDRFAPHRIVRLGLARTFQKDAEFPDLTVHETITLAAYYGLNLSRRNAFKAAEGLLETISFDPTRLETPTSELSVYERKQLMIGSALVMDPKVLMFDEPASGLTKPEIENLDKLLVKINKSGITVLLIEHVLSLLLSIAERFIVLDQGKLLAEGEPRKVISDEKVIEAYLGGRTK